MSVKTIILGTYLAVSSNVPLLPVLEEPIVRPVLLN